MDLAEKIKSKKASIGVVGLGYVGLPLAITFAESGFRVVGFELCATKKKALQGGKSYVQAVSDAQVAKATERGLLRLADGVKEYSRCDVIVICVPTPLNRNREPDTSYITQSVSDIADNLSAKHLIILESTTYPGTTDGLVRQQLEAKGKRLGRDFYLAFSPEREDPGNQHYTTKSTPKIVGGITKECSDLACLLYSQALDKIVPVSSARVAEMVKLLENIFRSVNIALVNELKIVADAMGMNIWEIVDAAATKPFGYMPFYPGPGLGGHCIPVDPFYLSWKAREFDLTTKFIELAGEINVSMHRYVLDKLIAALNSHSKSVNNSAILVCGVAYKKDIDDLRESPALPIISMLEKMGAKVDYYDPYVAAISEKFMTRSYEEVFVKKHCYDACLIVTEHSNVDYANLVKRMPIVVDCRNATRNVADKTNIFQA